MAKFPFSDLHSFKDYVIFVQSYLPDSFPYRDGAGTEEQWSLDLAFRGLREGVALARTEYGPRHVFTQCERLIAEAYEEYLNGRDREGFFKLEEINKLLKQVRSQ